MRPLHYALVRNEYIHQPRLLTSNWDELATTLAKPPAIASDRKSWSGNAIIHDIYCAICPSLFLPLDDKNAEVTRLGYRRCNGNVLGKDLLILDIDNDPTKDRPQLRVEQAVKLFGEYEFVLYTSFNHRNPAKGNVDKFRIVFPLNTYCPKDEWELRRERMKYQWPYADPASFTLSQIFFLPVTSPERQASYQFHHNKGHWYDWQEIKVAAKQSRPAREKPAAPTTSGNLAAETIIRLKDQSHLSAGELFNRLDEGYENSVRCYSPFRSDNKPDCFAYSAGPNLYVFDNATRQTTAIPILSRPKHETAIDPQIVIDGLANIAKRKQRHLASLHTVIQPEPPLPVTRPGEEAVQRMDCRYLGDFSDFKLPVKGLVFIKSPKGTGKTEMMKQFIQKYRLYSRLPLAYRQAVQSKAPTEFRSKCQSAFLPTDFAGPYKRPRNLGRKKYSERTLLIGHRIGLISSLAKRLGLVFYQDSATISGRFAISLDSLPRFLTKGAMREKPYDTIFLDESEQVLRHLTADTLKKRRNDVFNVFIRLIQNAKRVICLDADLSGILTIEVIAQLRGEEQLATDELIGYLNEYHYTDRSIEMFPTREVLITDLLTLVVGGERAFVATNVRAFAEKLAAVIQHNCPEAKILVVSSHTRDDESVKAFFNAPSTEALKYDVVIATPSMATGVSIDTKRHFNAVYGFFSQRPLTFQDCDQAISRVRELLPTKVWIQASDHEYPPRPKQYFYDMAKEREQLTRIRLPGEDAGFTQGELLWFDIYARLNWLEAAWMHDKRSRFIALKEEGGFTVTYAPYDDEAHNLGKAAMLEAKLDTLAIEVRAIMSAPDLNPEEAGEIAKKQVKTRPEELALSKYRIKTHLRQQPFSYENVYATHANKHLLKATRLEQALTDIRVLVMDDRLERHFSRAGVTDFSHRTKQVELWRELEKVANLNFRNLLTDSLCYFHAWQKLKAAQAEYAPRSQERREAQAAFDKAVENANITIPKERLVAIAECYQSRLDEYNLFFGCQIADPTHDGNQMKVWNATFGYFGLPLRKLKRGPRNNQVAFYEINYTSDGLLLEVMADEFIPKTAPEIPRI